MLSQEIEEKLAEILVDRIEKVNEKILKQIGNVIEEISTLKPSDAYRLGQILKYGGSYEKIVEELSKITKKNKQDIYKIFDEVATNNKQFAKDFYKYRGKDYIPYKKDTALRTQVEALASLTANTYENISNTKGIGFLSKDLNGNLVFKNLQQSYYDIVDKAIISIAQGKSTFQQEMRDAIKTMGHNGLVVYESGRVRRFDSAVRMNMLDGIRQLNIKTTQIIGKEIDADGVEISVHENPAPDHEDIQGRQFSLEQYIILEEGGIAEDVKGNKYDGADKRHIGEYNCYHKIFNIVIGVTPPEYSDEELKAIRERNNKGFTYEGKQYTMYEGTQLQRKLELGIRKYKDEQILARESGFNDLAEESQARINYLTKQYDDLCKASGLKPKKERMSVSGYRKIKTNIEIVEKDKIELNKAKLKDNEVLVTKEENEKLNEYFLSYYEDLEKRNQFLRPFEEERYNKLKEIKRQGYKDEVIKLDSIEDCNKLLEKVNTKIDGEEIKNTDFRLVAEASKELYSNSVKAPYILSDLRYNRATLRANYYTTTTVAETRFNTITLNNKYFSDYEKYKELCIDKTSLHEYVNGKQYSFWCQVAKGNETKQTIVHEFGHRLHTSVADQLVFKHDGKAFEYFYNKFGKEEFGRRIIDLDFNKARREVIYEPIRRLQKKTGLTQREIIDRYVSEYGKSNYDEIFAETFANSQLGKSNPLADELVEFLIEIGAWEK